MPDTIDITAKGVMGWTGITCKRRDGPVYGEQEAVYREEALCTYTPVVSTIFGGREIWLVD